MIDGSPNLRRADWIFQRFGGVDVSDTREFVARVNQRYYEIWGPAYDERHVSDIEDEYARLTRTCPPLSDGRQWTVVNIGGGSGFELRTSIVHGWRWERFILVEPAKAMVEQAQPLMRMARDPVEVINGSIQDLAIANLGSPLLVWINSAVHHIVWFDEFCEALGQLLRPGDRLLIGHEPRNEYATSAWWAAFGAATLMRRLGRATRRRPSGSGDVELWRSTIDTLLADGTLRTAPDPLVLRRVIDYGVSVKRDWRRLHIPPEYDEGFWTLSDLQRLMGVPSRPLYFHSYRHFGDAGSSSLMARLNTAAARISPRSGSQFLSLLEIEEPGGDDH